MSEPSLLDLEAEAQRRGLLLRLQVARPLGLLWGLRIGVARRRTETELAQRRAEGRDETPLVLLADLKGWALPAPEGLRVDTLQVAGREQGEADVGAGPLITAACFAWVLEATPCRTARFLAIRDGERQHRRLVRYFERLGFEPMRELGGAVWDLPARLIWGGSGLLMQGDCRTVLRRSARRLGLS
jgi:hypothetical protein